MICECPLSQNKDRVGMAYIVVSVSASHTVGRWFVPRSGHTKDHHKMVQTSHPCLVCRR